MIFISYNNHYDERQSKSINVVKGYTRIEPEEHNIHNGDIQIILDSILPELNNRTRRKSLMELSNQDNLARFQLNLGCDVALHGIPSNYIQMGGIVKFFLLHEYHRTELDNESHGAVVYLKLELLHRIMMMKFPQFLEMTYDSPKASACTGNHVDIPEIISQEGRFQGLDLLQLLIQEEIQAVEG